MTEYIETAKKSEVKPAKLKISVIVLRAIKNLKEKNGVNLSSIKTYITQNDNTFDMATHEVSIKKYLTKAVSNGTLTKGSKGKFKIVDKTKAEDSKKGSEKKVVSKQKKVVSKEKQKKEVTDSKEPKKKVELTAEEKLKRKVKKMKFTPIGQMVMHAIYNLKEHRKGSTLAKIRNFVMTHNKIDRPNFFNRQTKQFIASCVESGIFIQIGESKVARYKIANKYLMNIIKKKVQDPSSDESDNNDAPKSTEKQDETAATSEKKKKKSVAKTPKEALGKKAAAPKVPKPKVKKVQEATNEENGEATEVPKKKVKSSKKKVEKSSKSK